MYQVEAIFNLHHIISGRPEAPSLTLFYLIYDVVDVGVFCFTSSTMLLMLVCSVLTHLRCC